MPKRPVRPAPGPADRPRPVVSLLVALAIAVPSVGLGAFGDVVVEKARDVFAPSNGLMARTVAPAEPTLALPAAKARVLPKDLAEVRSRLDLASSPAELEELLARLGILGDATDIDRLEPFHTHRNMQVRAASFQALGRIGGEEAVERLTAYANGPVGDPDMFGAVAALGLAPDAAAGRALAKLAASPEQYRRDAAFSALAIRGGPIARRVLHKALLDGAVAQAWYAAQNVARLGEEPDARLLMRLAVHPGQRGDAALAALQQLPGEQVDRFLIALADEVTGARRDQVITALGGVRDPAVVELLVEVIEGAPRHRASGWQALGQTRAPGAIGALLDLISQASPADGWAVANALAARPEDEARMALRSLAVGDDALADAALGSLATLSDPKATELLLARYDEDGRLPPSDALTFLATQGGDEGWQLLEDVLAEGNQSDRNAVIWALQMRGDEDAVTRLLDLAKSDPTAGSTAMGALEMMGDDARDGLRGILVERIENGEDGDWGQSMQTLARLGGPEARQILEKRLENGTQMERMNALSALGSMDDPEARTTLTELFRTSDDSSMRTQALSTLLWSGDGLPPELVDEALADDDPSVVAQVVGALPQTGLPDVTEKLIGLADSDDLGVRTAALGALTQSGGPDAELTLVAALDDPDVAQSALWNLQTLGTPGARDAIRDAASSDDPMLRTQAIGALGSDTSPEALELLATGLEAGETDVVSASLSALQSRGNSSAAEAIAEFLGGVAGSEDPDELNLANQAAWALQGIGGGASSQHKDLIEQVLGADATGSMGMAGLYGEPEFDPHMLHGIEEAIIW